MIRYIANSKFSKILSSFMAFVIFFNNVIFPTRAFALTGGPSQPEFNSFDPAGASEMVNLFTGDFSYNIPLMDVDGYPVNIAYHASPSMDQEASWVGLGWNINAGAIGRSMRGLPDDFNGDPVHKEINMKPYKAWGVSTGYFGELFGLKVPINVNGSGGIGVFHSNYTGFGIEMSNSNTFGVSAGSKMQGSLTAGLGVKLNSQDGMDIYPQLGASARLNKNEKSTSIGVNIGCSINSREGLRSVTGALSISHSGQHKEKDSKPGDRDHGLGVSSSATIPMSSQGYMPKMIANMSSQAYNLDFKMGVNGCIYSQGGYISGYYAQNGINESQKDKDYNAYGYLYSQNAPDDGMLDFNREKDGMMYPELPNMPIANYTFDMFSANAQGMNYAFRPHRNDIGILHDNATIDNSFGLGIGGEIMFSTDINVGININVMFADGTAGKWTEDNDFNAYSEFTANELNSGYEAAYFKVAGEKNDDDMTFLNKIGNASDDAFRVKLNKKTSTLYFANNELIDKYGNAPAASIGSSAIKKGKRATRNELVTSLTASEAAKFGLNKKIQDYPELTQSKFTAAEFDDHIIQVSPSSNEKPGEFVSGYIAPHDIERDGSFCGNRVHHISETSITQDNGSRYIYGIPLYNRKQVEAMFNVSNATTKTNASIADDGLVAYSSTDATKDNDVDIDNFMEKTTLNDYSHGFLLSAILSADYVDRGGNGPSADDYGDYTKFNYSRVTGDGSYYNWRMPIGHQKAKFSQGLLGDRNDNKGVYMYGEKDLWYTQSIETKNYIAFFVLNDNTDNAQKRKDAFPVIGEVGDAEISANTARYLKEIRLYAKKDFVHGGIDKAVPIKIVNFEYDYSLCNGVPNNNAGTGKLTLKKIWFTYGNSQKGKLSPYIFSYADFDHDGTEDTGGNPGYNSAEVDRWGTYKPNSTGDLNNLDFPYVSQNDPDLNKQAAAWSLTQIKTPAGSTIKINYEADDYAYVQNKEAGQMFKIVGVNAVPTYAGQTDLLYGNDYLIIDLTSSGTGGINVTSTDAGAEFRTKYLKDLQKVYFRAKIDMDNKGENYEFVPGYAEIAGSGVCTSDGSYSVGGNSYYKYAFIKMKSLGINDKNQSTPQLSPIVKAGMQMGRMYLPHIVFPGSSPSSGNGSAVQGLVTTIKDSKYLLKGVNKALYNRDIAKKIDRNASVVRLYNPGGFKKGGGSRVSKITINNGWNAMTGEGDAEYGQEYAYTKEEGGSAVSSGVASYEPLLGGDEISLRYAIDFAIDKTFSPNDEYFQEEPMGESFFPDPLVGYSKITVRNIPKAGVTKHATGRTEYEFYTARDFPVVTDRTDLQKQRVKPKLLQAILKFGSEDKLYLSQGYVIKTNDMHGKLRSQKLFAEGSNDAISGMIYHYKSKPGIKSQELDNEVDVIDKTNTITKKIIGKTTDFYTDSRSAVNDCYTAGIGLNITSPLCTYYIPLVSVWPSFGHEHREFKSLGTTKLIQQYGLIDYVEAFENSSTVRTNNLLYDDVSGEVVLTETTNNFDAPVYNLKYPGYWAYEDMGAAFANAGIKFDPTVLTTGAKISSTYKSLFRPGDEVGVFDNVSPGGNFTRTWVVENKAAGNDYYLVNADGSVFTIPSGFNNTITSGVYINHLKILRSGRRNMQSAPMASLLSLKNPVTLSGSPAPQGFPLYGGSINATTASSVINSSAVEYSNDWNLLVGDKKVIDEYECECTVNTGCFNNLQSLVNMVFTNTSMYNQWNPSSDEIYCIKDIYNYEGNTYTETAFANYFSCIPGFDIHSYPYGLNFGMYKIKNFSVYPGHDLLSLIFGVKTYPSQTTCNVINEGMDLFCNVDLYLPTDASANRWNDVQYINNFQINTSNLNSSCTSVGYQIDFKVDCYNSSNVFVGTAEGKCPCIDIKTCESVYIGSQNMQCGKIVGDIANPYVENIRGNWRVKKSYSYLTDRTQGNQTPANMKGDIRQDGIYTSFNPFWKYNTSLDTWESIFAYNSNNPDKWVKNNEVDKINEYGNTLTARDVLNRPSASLYGYNHTLPVAAANNATYNQLAFDGFEDYAFINNECSASLLGTTSSANPSGYIEHFNFYTYLSQLREQSHTGRYGIRVPASSSLDVARKLTNPSPTGTADDVPYTIKEKDNYGMFGPYYSYAKAQNFVLSVWAKENIAPRFPTSPVLDYPNVGVTVSLNGVVVTTLPPKKSAIINGWQKLDYEFTVPASTPNSNGSIPYGSITVSLNNAGANAVFYDDLRIHPFNSSMKSMVYDPYSLRLMAELDDRNFATLYEYDEEGTLVRVKKETEKGIYTIKESRSGLKK
jgi:hypothetical protein